MFQIHLLLYFFIISLLPMDSSRLKKVLAGLSATAITLTQIGSVFAAYTDVPEGVWYEEAVASFTDAGYLDATQTKFRGQDKANRAEFVKLLVELNGGILSTPPAVASFDDVKASAWYYGYMEEAAKEGWVKGDKDCYGTHPCNARPGANINRAEAAALIARAFALEATGDAPQFVDNPSGQWYTDAIQTGADFCVLQGDDSTGRVRPADNMNRAEMVVMLFRVDQNLTYGVDCGTEDDGDDGDDGGPTGSASAKSATATSTKMVTVDFNADLDQASAETAANYKVTAGTAQVTVSSAKMIGDKSVELTLADDTDANETYTLEMSGLKTKDGDAFSDSVTFKGYQTIAKGNGVLEISVSSKNHAGDSVAKGAVGVSMLTLDLTASCDDKVVVEDFTILHEGFGASTDIDGVYAAVNGSRISRKRTIDSKDQSATVHLTTPLAVAACKTVTVDLMADISTTATTAAEHNLVIELPSDIIGNAKQVTGSFPLKGNSFRIASVTAGALSITYKTVSPNTVKVGDKQALLGKFEVAADNIEDQTLYSMTMEQNGTAHDGDVINLSIKRSDGTVLSNVIPQTTGDFVTFVFDTPFIVKQGDRITFSVVGDVVAGATNNVIMHFEESSDVFAVGSLYGYGVNGQLYGSQITLPGTDNSATTGTVTIDAGQLTVEINGPAQQTFTRDQNDAVLANIIFTTGGDRVDLRKLYIALEGETVTGATLVTRNTSSYDEINEVLKNVTMKNAKTGRGFDATRLTASADKGATAGVGTYQVYRFDDMTLQGQETYKLMVDFIDNGTNNSPKNGDQFKVHICGEPTQVSTGTNTAGCSFGGLITSTTAYNMSVEGQSTGDKVTDVRPRGVITGNAQRIANANLTVAVKAIGTLDTAVKNSKNVNFFRFEARAGEAKDLLLTKGIFKAGSGSLQNAQNYTLWVDTDYNGVVDTIAEKGKSEQSSQVVFDKLTGGGFVIPKEKTVVFEVHADLAGSFVSGANGGWLQLAFDTAVTYLESEDVVRGSSLSGIQTNGTCSGTCDMVVTTVASQPYKLVSQGDLYVTRDTVTNRAHQLLAGAVGDSILRLQFHAENEGIDVTDLQFTSSGSSAGSVDRLELWKDGATASFATATVGGCGSDKARSNYNGGGTTTMTGSAAFCAKMQSQQLVIPKGQDVKVLIKPRLKTDVEGATSNQVIQIFVDNTPVSNNATGSGAVRARGASSSNNLDANNQNTAAAGEIFIGTATATSNTLIKGENNVTVLSRITSVTDANPDSSKPSAGIPNGIAAIGQFKIAAAPNSNSKNGLNKVILSGVVFNINATNVVLSTTFSLYNKANTNAKLSCSPFKTNGTSTVVGVASGSFVVKCDNVPASTVNSTIDQGTDSTFVLEATINNVQVSSSATSTLQVSIQNFNDPTLVTYGGSTTGSHMQWADSDNSTTTKFTWVEYSDTAVKSTNYQS
ncbi:MAG: hypothetical protein Greene041619_926 [Candidatus Peregrinibacteria bacterium Greene0416_19]|nr:MAG: hypothetical protein Greene041619_926 [Candidatus Peregrinibacteria bacterium Greene0416_19]